MRGPKPNPSNSSGEPPQPPSWLSDEVLVLWDTLVPQLAEDIDLLPCDAPALADLLLCQHRLTQCEADITQRGLVVKGHRGQLVKNPAASLARAYRDSLQRARASFGLTPLSRLKVPRASTANKNPLEVAREQLRINATKAVQ